MFGEVLRAREEFQRRERIEAPRANRRRVWMRASAQLPADDARQRRRVKDKMGELLFLCAK